MGKFSDPVDFQPRILCALAPLRLCVKFFHKKSIEALGWIPGSTIASPSVTICSPRGGFRATIQRTIPRKLTQRCKGARAQREESTWCCNAETASHLADPDVRCLSLIRERHRKNRTTADFMKNCFRVAASDLLWPLARRRRRHGQERHLRKESNS